MASWHSRAQKARVPFLMLQVTNLSQQALPSAAVGASQWGCHLAAVAKDEVKGPDPGGVAVVVQHPWTASLVQKR